MVKAEHEKLNYLDSNYSSISNFFSSISYATETNSTNILDLELSQQLCNDYFELLKLQKRFDFLQKSVRENNLSITLYSDGFIIGNHKFQTLDDVEKAIKNKALL